MADAILNLKERNIMQIRITKIHFLIVVGIGLCLSGCSAPDLYNGVYAEREAIKKYLKDEGDYYNAESPQMKELRKQNQSYCIDLASKPKNRIKMRGYDKPVFNEPMFVLCMKKRGTPTYATYSAMQQEKLGSEFKTKGKKLIM